MKHIIAFMLFSISSIASADWQLDNEQSRLSFISIKKGDIAEVHSFHNLAGNVSSDGIISFDIELASVDTNIAIRDQRMAQWLFKTDIFPKATFKAKISPNVLAGIALSQTKQVTLTGNLKLNNVEQAVEAQLLIARIAKDTLIVTSVQPLIVNAKAFNLGEGVAKLQELANLPSISHAVPVNFMLTFKK